MSVFLFKNNNNKKHESWMDSENIDCFFESDALQGGGGGVLGMFLEIRRRHRAGVPFYFLSSPVKRF